MFDDPSIAQSILDKIALIDEHTESIKKNLSSAARASRRLQTSISSLVSSTTTVSTNLSNVSTHLTSAATSSSTLNNNVRNAARSSNNIRRSSAASKNNFVMMAKITGTFLLTSLLYVVQSMVKIQQQGAAFNQNLDITIQSAKNLTQVFRTGVIAGLTDLSMATVNLGRGIGDIRGISNDLIESTVELSNVYNVSEKSAAAINAQLFRWNGRNAELVKSAQQYNVALAKANGLLPGDIIEQMAQNTSELARYSNQGAEGFAKQFVYLNKMGTTMQAMAALADKLSGDFEGSLESAAKLQTFLPGFNIQGIQYAAQFGNTADVGRELQSALQASNLQSLSQLPRSLQNLISSSIGVPLDQIENLLKNTGQSTNVVNPTESDMDTNRDKLLNSGLDKIAGFLNSIKGGVSGILAYLLGRDITRITGLNKIASKRVQSVIGNGSILSNFGNILKSGTALPTNLAAGPLQASMLGKVLGRAGGIAAPVIGAGVSLAQNGLNAKGYGGAAGSVIGGLGGAALGSMLGPIGTLVGGSIGSMGGKMLGELIGSLVSPTKDLTDSQNKLTEANKAQESVLRTAASAAGVQDFAFAQSALAQSKGLSVLNSINQPNNVFSTLIQSPQTLQNVQPIISQSVSDPTISTVTKTKVEQQSSTQQVSMDTTKIEKQLELLTTLMKTGGIAVNLDGRKVSTGLMESNRYG